MNHFLAMGIPTTADDSGYFLWFANNWRFCVVPALIVTALLTAWVTRAVRSWSTRTPGPPDPPVADSQILENQKQPDPPPGSDEFKIWRPIELPDISRPALGSLPS
jgi:hypothetical protein